MQFESFKDDYNTILVVTAHKMVETMSLGCEA